MSICVSISLVTQRSRVHASHTHPSLDHHPLQAHTHTHTYTHTHKHSHIHTHTHTHTHTHKHSHIHTHTQLPLLLHAPGSEHSIKSSAVTQDHQTINPFIVSSSPPPLHNHQHQHASEGTSSTPSLAHVLAQGENADAMMLLSPSAQVPGAHPQLSAPPLSNGVLRFTCRLLGPQSTLQRERMCALLPTSPHVLCVTSECGPLWFAQPTPLVALSLLSLCLSLTLFSLSSPHLSHCRALRSCGSVTCHQASGTHASHNGAAAAAALL